ncbi:hypothetical protein ACSSS7_002971 [Eimeria intestinalis]
MAGCSSASVFPYIEGAPAGAPRPFHYVWWPPGFIPRRAVSWALIAFLWFFLAVYDSSSTASEIKGQEDPFVGLADVVFNKSNVNDQKTQTIKSPQDKASREVDIQPHSYIAWFSELDVGSSEEGGRASGTRAAAAAAEAMPKKRRPDKSTGASAMKKKQQQVDRGGEDDFFDFSADADNDESEDISPPPPPASTPPRAAAAAGSGGGRAASNGKKVVRRPKVAGAGKKQQTARITAAPKSSNSSSNSSSDNSSSSGSDGAALGVADTGGSDDTSEEPTAGATAAAPPAAPALAGGGGKRGEKERRNEEYDDNSILSSSSSSSSSNSLDDLSSDDTTSASGGEEDKPKAARQEKTKTRPLPPAPAEAAAEAASPGSAAAAAIPSTGVIKQKEGQADAAISPSASQAPQKKKKKTVGAEVSVSASDEAQLTTPLVREKDPKLAFREAQELAARREARRIKALEMQQQETTIQNLYNRAQTVSPSFNYVGIGYDSVKGNPLGDPNFMGDPGLRSPIIRFTFVQDEEGVTSDLTELQPLGAYSRPFVACKQSENLSEVATISDYVRELEADAQLAGGDALGLYSFSASASYRDVAKKAVRRNSKTFLLKTYCLRYEAGLAQTESFNW